jgi:hypothetical protein
MKTLNLAGAAALAISIAAGPAFAAGTDSMSPGQQSVQHDFGKLSKDGMKAFREIRDARVKIFQGNIAGAKKDIGEATEELQTAKTDDTAFDKAESDIKTPASMAQSKTASSTPSTTPVTWLPVDGAMTLDENYVTSPEKNQSVAKADEQLKSGDHKAALDTLKLANVDVDFVAELAPLNATIEGVAKARQLADAGHYFQANQALKAVEDGVRFDDQSFVATPTTKTGATETGATKTGATKTGATKTGANETGANETGSNQASAK